YFSLHDALPIFTVFERATNSDLRNSVVSGAVWSHAFELVRHRIKLHRSRIIVVVYACRGKIYAHSFKWLQGCGSRNVFCISFCVHIRLQGVTRQPAVARCSLEEIVLATE